MMGFHRHVLPAALLAALLAPAHAADSKPLQPAEKLFIHAAAWMVVDPSDENKLFDRARESAQQKERIWKEADDRILQALASIEDKPALREKYRNSLKVLLADKPEEQSRRLILRIRKDFDKEKLASYREAIKRSSEQKLEPGALPWPLCIPFDCCK